MNEYKYILEPYSGMKSRHTCPECRQKKTFSRYIDTDTGKTISGNIGRCNREINCGYHYTPKQYFEDNNLNNDFIKKIVPHRHVQKKETSFIQADIFKSSLHGYQQNNFIEYLVSLFGETITSELICRYFIGTSKHWNGATVFWQIDTSGKIRTGKIMLYNAETGKRIKEPFNHITWVHSALKLTDYSLSQCYFGEHLLKENDLPIAIVESEKTAVIASAYLPQFIWLAAGSSTNLKESNFKALHGRKVVLYPDLNCFDKWKKKADELSHLARISVSELLELSVNDEDKKQGFDIADYLVKTKFQYSNNIMERIQPKPKHDKEIISKPEQNYQTIGYLFDLMKKRNYKKLPENFGGANAAKWKTKIDSIY